MMIGSTGHRLLFESQIHLSRRTMTAKRMIRLLHQFRTADLACRQRLFDVSFLFPHSMTTTLMTILMSPLLRVAFCRTR